MLVTAAAVTAGLVIVSLATRHTGDADATTTGAAADLVYAALQWRETAVQDTDPALRLQHSAAASAYMQAARMIARDEALEQAVGVSVARLARSMERRVVEARQNLRPPGATRDVVVA